MSETSRHDAWRAGDSYERYMGRWSRKLAPRFLDWLDPADGLDWLDVGCGTGAISSEIVSRCKPNSLVALDPSEEFIATARAALRGSRADCRVGDAHSLPVDTASLDMVVSALVLNFLADRDKALAEMKRVARTGATVAFYVWDYPAGGVEFMNAFWRAAIALDAKAGDLGEDRRFAFCTRDGLTALAGKAGLRELSSTRIEVATLFRDFDDYWRPFTLGSGPAPGYCASLDPQSRERLRQRLNDSLPARDDGSIALKASAWAVKGTVA